MPVVEHDADVYVRRVGAIDQCRQHVALGTFAVLLQRAGELGSQAGKRHADRVDEVRQEPCGGVVVLVDRQPRRLAPGRLGRLDVLDRQHRLPVPRGAVDQDQPCPVVGGQPLEQPGAWNRGVGHDRWPVLGGDDGRTTRIQSVARGVEAWIPGGLDGRVGVGSPGTVDVGEQRHRHVGDGISEVESGLTQGGTERGRGVVAGRGVPRHRPGDHLPHGVGDPFRTQIGYRVGADPQQLRDEFLATATSVRGAPRDSGEQGGGQSVHIGGHRGWRPAQHLRSGVGGSPQDQPASGVLAIRQPGDPEVGQLGLSVVGEQDVRRLQIAVEHAGPVGGLERTRHLDPQVEDFCDGTRPMSPDPGVERAAGMEGHHDERVTGSGHPGLEDVHDVGMAGQAAHRLLLAQETHAIGLVPAGAQHLDGDLAVEGRLPTAVDDAETTASGHLRIGEPGRGQVVDDLLRRIRGLCDCSPGHGGPTLRAAAWVVSGRPARS